MINHRFTLRMPNTTSNKIDEEMKLTDMSCNMLINQILDEYIKEEKKEIAKQNKYNSEIATLRKIKEIRERQKKAMEARK